MFTISGKICIQYGFLQRTWANNNRYRVHGCEPVDGVLIVLSSNQLNIATFVQQIGDVCLI